MEAGRWHSSTAADGRRFGDGGGATALGFMASVLHATVCALALTYVMGQRYLETSKLMPAAVVAGLSALMSAFYLFKIATGGNHIPPKKE